MRDDLVRRAQSGDHDAYATLVRDSLRRLYGTARLILRDPGRAEDAVEDALSVAWRDMRGLRDPERLDAWLFRILVRSCHAAVRGERRHSVTEIAFERPRDRGRGDPTGALAARDEIERGFGRLSQDQRTILALIHFAGLSLPDASVALGVPVGTARLRLDRALDALRAAMADDDDRISQVWDGQIA